MQAGLAGARGQAVCSASQAPICEPSSEQQEERNFHNARWTFGFSIVRRLGRDCRSGSEKDTERVRLKGLLTNSAGLQRILRQVLLKDHETRPVKLMCFRRDRAALGGKRTCPPTGPAENAGTEGARPELRVWRAVSLRAWLPARAAARGQGRERDSPRLPEEPRRNDPGASRCRMNPLILRLPAPGTGWSVSLWQRLLLASPRGPAYFWSRR